MGKFKWSPTFDVGIDEMNDEHRGLFARMEKIEHLNHTLTPKREMLSAYDDLIMFTAAHFAHEERIMERLKSPELEAHRHIHEEMLEKLYRYRNEFEHSVYGAFPSAVFDFFENWLKTHILIVDKRYGDLINQFSEE